MKRRYQEIYRTVRKLQSIVQNHDLPMSSFNG